MKKNDFKKDFPFFNDRCNKESIIYLDSAATTLKTQSVIDALIHSYTHYAAPVHRGVYKIAEKTTELYEFTRKITANFFNAASTQEIIFTSGTTESLNLIAFGFFAHQLKQGDEIVISELEHNANVIPWQQISLKTGASLKYIPLLSTGDLDYDVIEAIITKKTKIVSITHASNAIGTIVSVERIVKQAKKIGAFVCIDAAQTAAHVPIDVQKLNIDFLVCSSHKLYGPYGVGILYAGQHTHEQFFPLRFGGGIISNITHYNSTLLSVPTRLEAGTPPIAEVIALKAAIEYIRENFQLIQKNEAVLFSYLCSQLSEIPGLRIIGAAAEKLHTISFMIDGYHAHDIAHFLDENNIAVRAGTHCAHIVSNVLHYSASIRISIGIYTDKNDIDQCIAAIKSVIFA